MNDLMPDVKTMTDEWAGEPGYYDWRQVAYAHPRFLGLLIEEVRVNKQVADHLERKRVPAVVYFVQQGVGGPIKVGASRNFEKRLKTLNTNSHVRMAVLATTPGGFELERDIHHELNAHRLEGEWFAPHPDVLAVVSRYR